MRMISPNNILVALAGSAMIVASAVALPPCRSTNNPFIGFGLNGGQRFLTSNVRYNDYFVTMGLKNLEDLSGHLLMESGGFLGVSRDEGCNWEVLYRNVPEWPLNIVSATGGNAYGFSVNRGTIMRVDYDGQNFTASAVRSPVTNILGLGTDPTDAMHVRISSNRGRIWESFDGGANWTPIGIEPPTNFSGYRAAFDPNDLDHAVYGAMVDGGWVTFDGGQVWTPVDGLSITGGPVNLFNQVISPVDGNHVWAMALDIDQANQGHPSRGKHLYLSTDGGLTFEPKVDNSADVTLTNGPELTPHPLAPTAIAWGFGSRWSGGDVYQYEASSGAMIHHHTSDIIIVRTVEYYLPDTRHLYLGLESP